MKNNKEFSKVKESIIEIVSEKLLTDTFKNISIDSIAKELRISKRTIYEIFKSKEDILELAIENHHKILIDVANDIANKIQNKEISFVDGVTDLMKQMSDKTIINSEIFVLLPEKARSIDNKKKNIFMKFYELAVNDGVIRKEINKDVHFMLTRVFAFAMFDAKTRREYNIEDNYNISDFIEIVYYGVLTDKGRNICDANKELLTKISSAETRTTT